MLLTVHPAKSLPASDGSSLPLHYLSLLHSSIPLTTFPGMGCASPTCTPEKHLLYGIITAIQLLVSPSRFGVLGTTE